MVAERLRSFAFSLPGATEDHPWGESVAKVRGKVFVFFGRGVTDHLGFSVKLPQSATGILSTDLAVPTGYGLGKAGWCSITCTRENLLPTELLEELVLESYRAVAPQKLIAQLG